MQVQKVDPTLNLEKPDCSGACIKQVGQSHEVPTLAYVYKSIEEPSL